MRLRGLNQPTMNIGVFMVEEKGQYPKRPFIRIGSEDATSLMAEIRFTDLTLDLTTKQPLLGLKTLMASYLSTN
jgi:hypothetical protein